MSLLGILLLVIGVWLLIYIKITSLITVRYYKKKDIIKSLAFIIKDAKGIDKLLLSMTNQSSNLDYDIYLFSKKKNEYADKYNVIVGEESFFNKIRKLEKKYDGYVVLEGKSILNKNYFKDLKRDIKKGYDIIYLKNSYYFKGKILFNSFSPFLDREEELGYYAIYYNLYRGFNKTMGDYDNKFSLRDRVVKLKEKLRARRKYIPLIKKSLKYKLPNYYERFRVCYLFYAYLFLIGGLLIFIGGLIV